MKRFFTSPAASHISSCSGLPFRTPLPMAGLERSCAASKREGVVVKDGLPAADAGQDAFAAAAEAGHHMMRHRAETDHEIGLGRRAVDGDRRAVGRCAE